MKENIQDKLSQIRELVAKNKNISPTHATAFFKTGPGEYAEHDQFIGVKVPILRKIASSFSTLEQPILQTLLQSTINEERLLALFILIKQYQKADNVTKHKIYQFYLNNLEFVNNWNLVDSSAYQILGPYLLDKDRTLLIDLAQSSTLWKRRIAIVSTMHFIRKGDFTTTLQLATLLLRDSQDLIQKAVGWMLREVGERDRTVLEKFLHNHFHHMPKTMLRYAIEKLPASSRTNYLVSKNLQKNNFFP